MSRYKIHFRYLDELRIERRTDKIQEARSLTEALDEIKNRYKSGFRLIRWEKLKDIMTVEQKKLF